MIAFHVITHGVSLFFYSLLKLWKFSSFTYYSIEVLKKLFDKVKKNCTQV